MAGQQGGERFGSRLAAIPADIRALLRLLRGRVRSGSHAERLQAFYAPQAERYDVLRERLLCGRAALIGRLAAPAGARVVELGAGTGRNLLFFGERLAGLAHVDLVDLCPALLQQARERTRDWPNVRVTEGDATTWQPQRPVDCVYFSYSLTMIPDWRKAIDNAVAMLRPGGVLGAVDFHVSAARPALGRVRHGWLARMFWRGWFGHEGVWLDPEHLTYLRCALPDHAFEERHASVPCLPGLRVPYYLFVGSKKAA